MPNDMIQWIVGQAGIGGVAILALVMLREAYQQREKDRDLLIKTLQGVTEVMTKLTSAVERSNDVSEKCKLAQAARGNE